MTVYRRRCPAPHRIQATARWQGRRMQRCDRHRSRAAGLTEAYRSRSSRPSARDGRMRFVPRAAERQHRSRRCGQRLAHAPVAGGDQVVARPREGVEAARLQSRTTHGAVQAVEACALFAEILVESIAGHPKESVLRCREWDGDARIAEVAAGSWRTKERDAISSSGYVLHTLEAALWCVDRTESVADALILAVNLGHDADTVGAVTGQLAGALWGMSGAPTAWLDRLRGVTG